MKRFSCGLALIVAPIPAAAEYPTKPVRLLVVKAGAVKPE